MITLWGTQDQIDAIRRDPDRTKLQLRAGLVVEDLVETGAIRGAALLEGIGTFQEALDSL